MRHTLPVNSPRAKSHCVSDVLMSDTGMEMYLQHSPPQDVQSSRMCRGVFMDKAPI
jgi:hypothetical protein